MISFLININEDCIGCGECSDICPTDVLIMNEGKAETMIEQDCVGCYSCEQVCPTEAITVND